jgi:L-fuculose-phosphate aldolase
VPIAEYATPSTKELPEAVRQYVQAHDGMLLANHGALTLGKDLFSAYYKMETIEHFARISLVARMLGGERLLSQDEVLRLQSLRGMYGIAAPAPICLDDAPAGDDAACQFLRAPDVPGARLVSEERAEMAMSARTRDTRPGDDEEIRITYRELTALIEDAVRQLR